MMWKKIATISLLSALTMATALTAHAQELEDARTVRAAYLKHSVEKSATTDPSVFLSVLINDVNQFGAEKLGVINARDVETLIKVSEVDLLTLQQNALQPYLQKICRRLQADLVEIFEASRLYMRALEDEAAVTRQVYVDMFRELSSEGTKVIEVYMHSLASNGRVASVDWIGMAGEVPLFTQDMLSRTCQPALSDEAVKQVVNRIIGN